MIQRQPLQPRLLISLVLATSVAALWPSVWTLLQYWFAIQDYQHSLLIVPLAIGWIVLVLRRPALRDVHPSAAGCGVLSATLLLWLIAVRASLDIAHQVLWPLAMWAALWAAVGWRVALGFAAPLGLFYCVIPIWDYLMPVLQRLSIFFSEHMLAAMGVQATVTENRVTIPEGTFSIVEGCSGKRYLIVAIAIAWLSAAIHHVRRRGLALLFATAVLLALLINWIRIVIIIYAGHVTHMEHYLVAVEHQTLGNLLFLPLLAGILIVARYCANAAAHCAPSGVGAMPPQTSLASMMPTLALAVVAILVHVRPVWDAARLGAAPLGTTHWEGPLPARSGWRPVFRGAGDEARLSYQSQEGIVELYVNVYGDQESGKELVQYSNTLTAPAGWLRPWLQRGKRMRTSQGRHLWGFEMQGPDERIWLVAYTYRIARGLYLSETATKLAYGVHSLFGPTPGGIVALASSCDATNCDKARTLVADFWDNMSSPILSMLPD